VAIPEFPLGLAGGGSLLDPQKDYFFDSWELFRCCLLRTLLSHNGHRTAEGGAVLRPDLAAGMPHVSPDGLTWTFRIRDGLTYAPPFADTEIVSGDFVRALEREGNPQASKGGYAFYYSVIDGFDDFVSGKADSISGLEAPDPHTLVVHVLAPQGDLGNLFAMPATAPIPPGAAEGHVKNYGPILVASGPYRLGSMVRASGVPAMESAGATERDPLRTITLVRNPSWDPATDPLRKAYVDRIEISLGGDRDRLARKVAAGELDMQVHVGPPPQEPLELVRELLADPELKHRVFIDTRDSLKYIPMNIGVPPFDDIHVRKAVNYAVDKDRLRDLRGGPVVGEITGHAVLNSLENNLLLNYDPYATPGGRGSLRKAREEMRLSRYDHDGDGRCDDPRCDGVLALSFLTLPELPIWEDLAASVARDLAPIGIRLRVRAMESSEVFVRMGDPSQKIPIAIGPGWLKDFLNASNFLVPLVSSDAISQGNNFSLVGASPEQLEQWGYRVKRVPSIDNEIAACQALTGSAQFQCWARADQLLMERVVPWVSYLEENRVQIVSDRVVNYSFDQFANLPALDRIALRPGSD
jgi:peptide/nickel transport system substrate-binding protein